MEEKGTYRIIEELWLDRAYTVQQVIKRFKSKKPENVWVAIEAFDTLTKAQYYLDFLIFKKIKVVSVFDGKSNSNYVRKQYMVGPIDDVSDEISDEFFNNPENKFYLDK